jgi:transcriptional regulator with XRE-family HTH domain
VLVEQEGNYNERLDITNAFSAVLLKLRKERGLTHEALAELAGLHPTTISLLERSKRQPSVTTLFQIACALKVQPDEIVRSMMKLRSPRS